MVNKVDTDQTGDLDLHCLLQAPNTLIIKSTLDTLNEAAGVNPHGPYTFHNRN